MQKSERYEKEEDAIPRYEVSKELAQLTVMFIVAAVIYFLIAGSLAIVMRVIQSDVIVLESQPQTFGLFYASLTVHGQVMFFGFASMLVVVVNFAPLLAGRNLA